MVEVMRLVLFVLSVIPSVIIYIYYEIVHKVHNKKKMKKKTHCEQDYCKSN